jgi:hypothetical protein
MSQPRIAVRGLGATPPTRRVLPVLVTPFLRAVSDHRPAPRTTEDVTQNPAGLRATRVVLQGTSRCGHVDLAVRGARET